MPVRAADFLHGSYVLGGTSIKWREGSRAHPVDAVRERERPQHLRRRPFTPTSFRADPDIHAKHPNGIAAAPAIKARNSPFLEAGLMRFRPLVSTGATGLCGGLSLFRYRRGPFGDQGAGNEEDGRCGEQGRRRQRVNRISRHMAMLLHHGHEWFFSERWTEPLWRLPNARLFRGGVHSGKKGRP